MFGKASGRTAVWVFVRQSIFHKQIPTQGKVADTPLVLRVVLDKFLDEEHADEAGGVVRSVDRYARVPVMQNLINDDLIDDLIA